MRRGAGLQALMIALLQSSAQVSLLSLPVTAAQSAGLGLKMRLTLDQLSRTRAVSKDANSRARGLRVRIGGCPDK